MFASAFKSFTSSIHSKYSISNIPQFQAEPWTVYSGKRKDGGDEVAIFVYDKREMVSSLAQQGLKKDTARQLVDKLKREVANLAKIRHPSILKLIEPLEETKGTLTFVAEAVSTNLSNLLIGRASRGSSGPEDLNELVIQRGLLHVTEGLIFLHQNAGFVHLDIQPKNIYIDTKGDWKIGGLGFIENYQTGGDKDYFIPQFDPRVNSYLQVNFDFSAPEMILDHKLNPSNDIFSLGCLILSIYNKAPPLDTDNNISTYREDLTTSLTRATRGSDIPAYLKGVIPRLVSRQPLERLDLEAFRVSEYFDNPLVRAISFLDDFPAKLSSEKKVFLDGLFTILGQFPKSVAQKKILQSLIDELGKDDDVTYLLLKNILTIGKDMSQLGFSDRVLPCLNKVKGMSGCHQAILDFLPVFLSRLSQEDFKKHILHILTDMIINGEPERQKEVLKQSEVICDKLDFIAIKNELFPSVCDTFGKTNSLGVKLECLKTFNALIAHELDKYVITEKLLPLLSKMKTREADIIMSALDVYISVSQIVDVETLCISVIPQILALSTETSLYLDQFHTLMQKVREILDRVEQGKSKELSPRRAGANGAASSIGSISSRSTTPGAAQMDFNTLISSNPATSINSAPVTPALKPSQNSSNATQASLKLVPNNRNPYSSSANSTKPIQPSVSGFGSISAIKPASAGSSQAVGGSSIDWSAAASNRNGSNTSHSSIPPLLPKPAAPLSPPTNSNFSSFNSIKPSVANSVSSWDSQPLQPSKPASQPSSAKPKSLDDLYPSLL